jgi:hypothetical protein
MKLLKYESFLETMQFAVLTNQRLADEQADRKSKQETPKTIDTDDDYYGQEGDLEMEPVQAEGDLEMEPEGEGMEPQVQAEGDLD